VEKTEFIPRLEASVPGAVLEVRPFGRAGEVSVWVEGASLPRLARYLRQDPASAYDWVENLSAFETGGVIVLTYFLRSGPTGRSLILRASVEPPAADAPVDLPSVADEWPSAASYEDEIASLFGVRFIGVGRAATPVSASPDGNGFPLRKSYAFPTDVMGFPHMRKKAGAET